MSLPTTSHEYHVTKPDGFQFLQVRQSNISPPRDNEVLVKIHAVSLQYRDIAVATGKYPLGQKEDVVPCSDCAAEVLCVGSEVKGFKPGDRVCANFSPDHVFGDVDLGKRKAGLGAYVDGVLTEYRLLPAHCLVHIPEHLSYEEASTLPCAAVTAYNALNGPVPLKGGDVVLVEGTGGVSIFGLQFAKASGASVICITSTDEKGKLAKALGADLVINYKKNPDWDKEALKFTNGLGVDHIIEIGGSGTIMRAFNAIKFAGWIHAIGFLAQGDPAPDLQAQCLMKSAYLRGILVGSRAQFEAMNRLISTAKLRPVVDKVFSFEEAPQAYEYLASQQHVGKVVIKVTKD